MSYNKFNRKQVVVDLNVDYKFLSMPSKLWDAIFLRVCYKGTLSSLATFAEYRIKSIYNVTKSIIEG